MRKRAFDALAPALAHQAEFNALVVQVLNGTLTERARLETHLRDVIQAVVRYMQRVQPFVDARARLGTAHATTRAELILEAFDRRQESLARRFDGLSGPARSHGDPGRRDQGGAPALSRPERLRPRW